MAGRLARAPLALFLGVAVLLAAGLATLWERYCLAGAEYRRRSSRRRVAFGEAAEPEGAVVNRKPLPLAWLEVQDELPARPPPARGRVYASPNDRLRERAPVRCRPGRAAYDASSGRATETVAIP